MHPQSPARRHGDQQKKRRPRAPAGRRGGRRSHVLSRCRRPLCPMPPGVQPRRGRKRDATGSRGPCWCSVTGERLMQRDGGRRRAANTKREPNPQGRDDISQRGKDPNLGWGIPMHLIDAETPRLPADGKAGAVGIVPIRRTQNQRGFLRADTLQLHGPVRRDAGNRMANDRDIRLPEGTRPDGDGAGWFDQTAGPFDGHRKLQMRHWLCHRWVVQGSVFSRYLDK